MRLGPLLRSLAEALPQRTVSKEPADTVREARLVVGLEQNARAAVRDDVGDPTDSRRCDWTPAGGGLDQHRREVLTVRRRQEHDVCRPIDGRHVRADTGEYHRVVQPELADQGSKLALQLATTDERKHGCPGSVP